MLSLRVPRRTASFWLGTFAIAAALSMPVSVSAQSAQGTVSFKPTPAIQILLDAAMKVRTAGNYDESVRLYTDAVRAAEMAKDTAGTANAYIGLGNTQFAFRKYTDALPAYQSALTLRQTLGDTQGTALVQSNIGNAYLKSGDAVKALVAYNAAIPVLESAGNTAGLASALNGLGAAQEQNNLTAAATTSYERALGIYKSANNTDGVAITLTNLGALYQKTSQPAKAVTQFEQALVTFKQSGNKAGIATVLNNLGSVYLLSGKTDAGIASYQQLATFSHENGDFSGEAKAISDLGEAYSDMGRSADAMAAIEKSLALYRQVKDSLGEARSLVSLGYVQKQRGDFRKSQTAYTEAQTIYDHLAMRSESAGILVNLANVQQQLDDPQKALALYEQALPVLRNMGNKTAESAALNGIGGVYLNIGDPMRSLGYFDQSLVVSRTNRDRRGEADALCNGGAASRMLGNGLGSLGLYGQALPIYQEIKDARGEAATLSNIGNIFYDAGQVKDAVAHYEKALPIFTQLQDKRSQAILLGNLGGAYALMGGKANRDRGIASLEKALPILREIEDRYNEASTLTNLGSVYRAVNQPEKALAAYQTALAIQREIGNRRGEANALVGIGETRESQKRYAEAEIALRDAIVAFEDIRSNLGNLSESKVVFLASTIGPYQRYINLLLRQNNVTTAFETVQKTKARALLDLMASGRVDIVGAMTEDERKQEHDLRLVAEKLNQQMLREATLREEGSRGRIAELRVALTKAENDIVTFRNGIYARHPELSSKRIAKTATVADMNALLPEDTVLLEYVVLKSGSGADAIDQTICFVVTKTAGKLDVKAITVKVPFDMLFTTTNELRRACANPMTDYKPLAKTLYRQLIAPAQASLVGHKRLVICPDGPIWDVPFAVLTDGNNKPLLDDFEIVYSQSATSIQSALLAHDLTGRTQPTGTLFAVANPAFGGAARFGTVPAVAAQPTTVANTADASVEGRAGIDMMSRAIDMMSRGIGGSRGGIDMMSRSIDMMSRSGIDMMSRGGIDMMSRGGIDMMSRGGIDMMSRGGIDMMSRGGIDMMSRDGSILELPGTQREVDALKQGYDNPTVLTREKAQKSTIIAEAGKYRYIHIASHAFANDAAPLSSGIVLAAPLKGGDDDGILSARDIFDMNLSADMVCLSACNTGRGQTLTGEGVVGLTWALFVAGAPTTVVSQWAVNDDSTALLMQHFYGNLAKGDAKSTALRDSALLLMKDGKHSHPYYWAPFILLGDWRK